MSHIPLILGSGLMGHAGTLTRIHDPAVAQQFIDTMIEHGHVGIDSGQNYGNGTSEKLLGAVDFRGQARVDTKLFPLLPGDHNPEKIKRNIQQSISSLNGHKIRVFYLHAPDRATSFEQTLEAVNDLYQQGIFEEFGLSNFMSWEVAEVVCICDRRGFKRPTVYQGIYNLLDRTSEGELFPCLRKFGIRFAAYTTLAGGYLTGEHLPLPSTEPASEVTENNHFDPNWHMASFYISRYPPMVAAVTNLRIVAEQHGFTLTEVAYRWLQWHSKMIPEDYGVIVGASKIEQLENAIRDSAKGPLPTEVVQACEKTWLDVKGVAKNYWLESAITNTIAETVRPGSSE